VTARRLQQIAPVPDALLDLTPDELAWALLEDMQARGHDPIAGMAVRLPKSMRRLKSRKTRASDCCV